MAELKSGIQLSDDEQVVAELEAEFWAGSSNPIARFFGAIGKIFCKIFGFRKEGYLVITNKSVIQVVQNTHCYVFKTGKDIKYVLPASIKEVGYTREATCCCCCPVFYFYYESLTQKTNIQVTGKEEDVQKIVDAFYNAISNAQAGNE